jgi:hypothetical protein
MYADAFLDFFSFSFSLFVFFSFFFFLSVFFLIFLFLIRDFILTRLAQLLKKKTNKAEFSGNVIKDLREKYSANDRYDSISKLGE